MIVLRKISTDSGISRGVPLSGDQNGTNKKFITPDEYIPGKIVIYYNGQGLQPYIDFLMSGPTEITFIHFAPHHDDIIRASYDKVRY